MRFSLAAAIGSCALLASCAYQGVIVDKTAREMPFGLSNGVNGSFAFMLKDNAGAVHRQLVTPDVFVRYEVGDYFNDMQPGPARQRSDGKTTVTDGKTTLTAMISNQPQNKRAVAARKATTSNRVVAKKNRKAQTAVAVARKPRAKKIVPSVKPEQARVVAAIAESARADVAYVGAPPISRCR